LNRLLPRPTWIEVDLEAISFNLGQVKRLVGADCGVMGVVKADAYGHGAVEVSRTLVEAGVDYLGVAVLEEALELRRADIHHPILILGNSLPEYAAAIVENDLAATVCNREMIDALSTHAAAAKKPVNVHLKFDTGMGRLGPGSRQALDLARHIAAQPWLVLEGLFSHFSSAGHPDQSYTLGQWKEFHHLHDRLAEAGINPRYTHVANSAAIMDLPGLQCNLVRPGLMLYGLHPAGHMAEKVPLRPALTLKARLVYVKRMEEDGYISYDRTYLAPRGATIATLPLGYADGFNRGFSNRGEVLLRGKRVPVVGLVCMDMFMIQADDMSDLQLGEEAVLIGRQGEERITVDDLARSLGTISYEICCLLGRRFPRVYMRGDRPESIRTLLESHRVNNPEILLDTRPPGRI